SSRQYSQDSLKVNLVRTYSSRCRIACAMSGPMTISSQTSMALMVEPTRGPKISIWIGRPYLSNRASDIAGDQGGRRACPWHGAVDVGDNCGPGLNCGVGARKLRGRAGGGGESKRDGGNAHEGLIH